MRIASLALLFAAALPAQNFTGRIQIKPLLPPISQPWKTKAPAQTPLLVRPTVEESRPCAVPLLAVRPADTDAKMVVPPPAQGYHMRFATLPAPPCDAPSRR